MSNCVNCSGNVQRKFFKTFLTLENLVSHAVVYPSMRQIRRKLAPWADSDSYVFAPATYR
jgi:hypothetical protein